jgi:hypothetical protein
MLDSLTRGYNNETQQLINNGINPNDPDQQHNRINQGWKPQIGVPDELPFRDYVTSWTKCCNEQAEGGHKKGTLTIVDTPGNFNRNSKGTLHFTITFRSNPYFKEQCEGIARCIIEFDLAVANGTVSIKNKNCYCVNDETLARTQSGC